jgi:uracil phosphoribosyltransferase
MVRLLAAPEGVERYKACTLTSRWTAGIDDWLDEHAFILPELGDAVDRAYGKR